MPQNVRRIPTTRGTKSRAVRRLPTPAPWSRPVTPQPPQVPAQESDARRRREASLRERVLAGEEDAATELFEEHLDALYEFVHYRLGHDRAAVEDVVQDTFLIALQKLDGFRGESTLHTWLCGIARNLIRSSRRKKRPLPLADVLEGAESEIHDVLLGIEQEALPDWVLEQQETRELVGAALGSLPPDYRQLLTDKYIEELSVSEIADAAGHGYKATESRLHRARLAFSRVFQVIVRGRGGLS